MNSIELTKSQQNAFDYIIGNLPKDKVILLQGSAGTGKTTLTKYICNYYKQQKGMQVCAIAPTHKSKKVIERILNQNTIIPITAFTVASALGKIKEHSYVGTKIFTNSNIKKLSSYNLFIIDEVSMISDVDLKIIIDYVTKVGKQSLIIGDSNQIPCPSAKYVLREYGQSIMIEKADSFIFDDTSPYNKLNLTDIVRQASDSPIIQLATFLRDNLLIDLPFKTIVESVNFTSTNIITYPDTYHTFMRHFQKDNINSCRIIAYTNSAVKTHNLEVRYALQYQDEFVVGELLTGNTNVGWPDLIICNGEDYFITKIQFTTAYSIGKFSRLSGKFIDLIIPDTKIKVKNLFFINIHCENNYAFINRLIELAEKINELNSTKTDYRNYMELKNCVIFTDDIYKFEGRIFTETTFKETHALLFVNINEIIVDGVIKQSLLAKKINTTYSDIIEKRISDTLKPLGESETFADKYKVIEKDIYYGYSITAHKSQGSTYTTAIVDEPDFQRINNRWNHKYNKLESRVKEKNQLRYVAYTRSKTNLYIIYEEVHKEKDILLSSEEEDYYTDESFEQR
jgi:energy-coupling factor transporter ATP-binding protein EcfA2